MFSVFSSFLSYLYLISGMCLQMWNYSFIYIYIYTLLIYCDHTHHIVDTVGKKPPCGCADSSDVQSAIREKERLSLFIASTLLLHLEMDMRRQYQSIKGCRPGHSFSSVVVIMCI